MNTPNSSFHFVNKLFAIYYRVVDYIRLFPWRVYRIFKYLIKGFLRPSYLSFTWWKNFLLHGRPVQKIFYWFAEVAICILEFFGIAEIYETICDFSKPKTRPLHNWEIKIAKEVFGNSINYKRVRIDESAYIGPKQHYFCYVSFYIINSWGAMRNSTLIHELVHVWQYQNMGAVYMPRALWAQSTREGYNYGGIDNLKLCLAKEESLFDFNLEQQGDIVADYFNLKTNDTPRHGTATKKDIAIYEKVIYEKVDKENFYFKA